MRVAKLAINQGMEVSALILDFVVGGSSRHFILFNLLYFMFPNPAVSMLLLLQARLFFCF